MIEYINRRLNDWASWVKRRDDGGCGYVGVARYCELVSTHGNPQSGPIVYDAAALEIDKIVSHIKSTNSYQYAVVHWFYMGGNFSVARVAQELHCSRDTVYVRVHALHITVLNMLHKNDINAR